MTKFSFSNGWRRLARRILPVCAGGLCVVAAAFSSRGVGTDVILWYNGDPRGGGGGAINEQSTDSGTWTAFDNFSVSAPYGWNVDRIWAFDDFLNTVVSQVSWSIRSGMSNGHLGTPVLSGISPVTQTLIGPSDLQGYTKYRLDVTGLNFQLGSGTYWLSIVPLVGSDPGGADKSYLCETLGDGAVGTAGIDGNAFLLTRFGDVISIRGDYALGLAGATVVPEPSGLALLLASGSLLAWWRRSWPGSR